MSRGRKGSGIGSRILGIVVLIIAGIALYYYGKSWLVKLGILKSTIYFELTDYESIYSEDEPFYYGYVEDGKVLSPDHLGKENVVGSDGKVTLKAGKGYFWGCLLYKDQVNYCNFSGYYNNSNEGSEFVGYKKLSFEDSIVWTAEMNAPEISASLLRAALIKADGDEPLPEEIEVEDAKGFRMKWTRNSQGDIVILYNDGDMSTPDTSLNISSKGYQTLNVPFDFSEHRVVTQHISFAEDK